MTRSQRQTMASSSRRSVISRSGSMAAGCRHGCRRPGPRSPSPLDAYDRRAGMARRADAGHDDVAEVVAGLAEDGDPTPISTLGRQLIGSDTVAKPGRARVSTSAWRGPGKWQRSAAADAVLPFKLAQKNGERTDVVAGYLDQPLRTYCCTGIAGGISCVQWKIGAMHPSRTTWCQSSPDQGAT